MKLADAILDNDLVSVMKFPINELDESSLILAADNGHLEIVAYIVSKINVNRKAAIEAALGNGFIKVATFLLQEADHNEYLETIKELFVGYGYSIPLKLSPENKKILFEYAREHNNLDLMEQCQLKNNNNFKKINNNKKMQAMFLKRNNIEKLKNLARFTPLIYGNSTILFKLYKNWPKNNYSFSVKFITSAIKTIVPNTAVIVYGFLKWYFRV